MDRDFKVGRIPYLTLSLFSEVSFLFHLAVEAR
jgi:hypothetical protein